MRLSKHQADRLARLHTKADLACDVYGDDSPEAAAVVTLYKVTRESTLRRAGVFDRLAAEPVRAPFRAR